VKFDFLNQLARENPQMAAMLQNPMFRSMLMQPGLAHSPPQPQPQPQPVAVSSAPTDNATSQFAAMFAAAAAATAATAGTPSVPLSQQTQAAPAQPQLVYQEQLALLADMGFADEQAVLRALIAANGNLDAAVDILGSE
jgi:ubiquilin